MSGPKVLTPKQQKAREEREARLRLVQERARRAAELRRLEEAMEDVQGVLAQVLEEPAARELSRKLAEAAGENARLAGEWDGILASGKNRAMEAYTARLEARAKEVRKLEADARRQAEDMRRRKADRLIRAQEAVQKESGNREQGRKEDEARIGEMVRAEEKRLESLLDRLEARAKRAGMDRAAELRDLRRKLRAAAGEKKRERMMDWEDMHRLDLFAIQPLRRAVEEAEERRDWLDAELSRELAAYHALCAGYGITPRKFPFSEASVREIRYAEAEILRRNGGTAGCAGVLAEIRRVLGGMGYAYIGEKEEDRQVVRQVYRIRDRTVLHVIADSTGRVTMEVAVEDECDRDPCRREVEQIVDAQGAFCGSFSRILDALAADGMPMDPETLCPCGEEYAQVVNISGFRKEPEREPEIDWSLYESPERKYLQEK